MSIFKSKINITWYDVFIAKTYLRWLNNFNEVYIQQQWNYESCPYMRPDDEIWRKWSKATSDSLGDIDEVFKTLRNMENVKPKMFMYNDCPYYYQDLDYEDATPLIVSKGSAVGATTCVNVIGHIDRGKSIIQIAVKNVREAEIALLMFGESLQAVNFPFENIPLESLERRYMPVPEVIIEKPNNKPWYQDRKHYQNKKSRRKL